MTRKDKDIEYIELPDKNGWMTTFSDMVTLLITFFVLLISMSAMNDKEIKDIFGFFNDVSGPLNFGGLQEVSGSPKLIDSVKPKVYYDAKSLSRSVLMSLDNTGKGGLRGRGFDSVEVRESRRGLAVILNGDILFVEGSSEFEKDALPILKSIAEVINETDSVISVEGHTDNSGEVRSNYLLSLMRATSVLDYFIYTTGLSPTRFCMGGYGPSRPVAPNTTKNGRARNRRVEIILLKDRI